MIRRSRGLGLCYSPGAWSLWGPLNKFCVALVLRGASQLRLHLRLITTRQSKHNVMSVTHFKVSASVCACVKRHFRSHSTNPAWISLQTDSNCNVCDIKWTMLKLQAPSIRVVLSLGSSYNHHSWIRDESKRCLCIEISVMPNNT